MRSEPDILCIGAVLWDVIGRARQPMLPGDDLPGRITRRPGGVAMNVAIALAREGLRPALLGAIGTDTEGDALIQVCDGLGISTDYLFRSDSHPTDIYIAIEADQGLVAAVADTGGLDAAGHRVLAPLVKGPLGRPEAPYDGTVVVDGNLPEMLIAEIMEGGALDAADLRVAPASPVKARHIAPLIRHERATLYLNRAEAGMLLGRVFADAHEAARALRKAGVVRALVTDGQDPAVFAWPGGEVARAPTRVASAHVTGAGDALMAAHIAAERAGAQPEFALRAALSAAGRYVARAPLP